MSVIIEALYRLNDSLESLEKAAIEQQHNIETMKAEHLAQQDLFAKSHAAAAQGGAPIITADSDYIAIDSTLWVQKLDMTINRIEQILSEG